MSDVTIVEVGPDSPHLGPAVAFLDRQHAGQVRGPSAPAHLAEIVATWTTREAARWMAAAIGAGGDVVAAVSAEVLREGNDHLVDADLAVDLSHRRRGIGAQLWHRLVAHARAEGTDTILGYTGRPVDADVGWRLIDQAAADPSLTVNLNLDEHLGSGVEPSIGFAEVMGATQGQVEIQSRLDLPLRHGGIDMGVLDETLAPLEVDVAGHASAYDVLTFMSAPPEQYMAGLVELSGRMMIDAPFGDLDIRPDVRDRDRFDEMIRVWEGAGRLGLGAIAVERATGAVAALSELMFRRDDPMWGDQGDTIVAPAHRGHRLGLAVKIAALRRLLAENPAVRYVETYNAMENGPMFAVNRALGFQPVSAETVWQYKVPQ